jgi:signal transduction histidine kinase
MTQAVRNERLAVRQKLVDFYQGRAEDDIRRMPPLFPDEQKAAMLAFDVPDQLLLEAVVHRTGADCEGLVVYGDKGAVLYPVTAEQHTYLNSDDLRVAAAWKLEFTDANYMGAAQAYKTIADGATEPFSGYEGRAAQLRCLVKAGRLEEAKGIAQGLSDAPTSSASRMSAPADMVMRTRVMLAQLYADTRDTRLASYLSMVMSGPYSDTPEDAAVEVPCGADTRIWALGRLASIAESAGVDNALPLECSRAAHVAESDTLSLVAARAYPTTASLGDWPANTIRRLKTQEELYGIHFGRANRHLLVVLQPGGQSTRKLLYLVRGMEDPTVWCRILDERGDAVIGDPNASGTPFLQLRLAGQMPDWRLELHFTDASVFENAANKQAAVYMWMAILVISLIGSVAIVAGFSINRQMKLNRLKNDFVATVTHELKTPISSMRVLVDTLLAGDCKDQKQEREYLELIARENLRLSRLIDNFLTFSRMERNKKAFDIKPCQPEKVMADAAEAIRTKFGSRKCNFTAHVDGELPEVMADHDSIVTVLVNLLDNACKYSGDYKQISLRAYAANGDICFAVKDNGLGMTKRVVRRIFDRFYQADQSLARSAEGCGLGLSIVKFIVDAHKGKIEVESTPGKGSCFTVRLPAASN